VKPSAAAARENDAFHAEPLAVTMVFRAAPVKFI